MTITLTFTQEQMAVLNKALVELPFREVAGLIMEINKQIAEARKEGAVQETIKEEGKV